MDVLGKMHWISARDIARCETIYWTGNDMRPHWGMVTDVQRSSRLISPRTVTITLAPGYKTWPTSLVVDIDTLLQVIINPVACLPKLNIVLPKQCH